MAMVQAANQAATTGEINAAHVLRRLTFGPHPGQVEAGAAEGTEALIARLVANADQDTAAVDGNDALAGAGDDDSTAMVEWWLRRMSHPDSGLHERLVWFWHTHFTTSIQSADFTMMRAQHQLLRDHAAGNFRELFRNLMTDPAMLIYLNGDISTGESPNENLARESMELFTLGPGNYTEADVRNAARALAGWRVNWDEATAYLDTDVTWNRPVDFLGSRGRMGVDEITDAICDQPTCSRFIAAKLHRYFCGVDPTPERLDALADTFADADLEIVPLVEAIATHPDFLEHRLNRARTPVEWFVSVTNVTGRRPDIWVLHSLGQMPLSPPNVGGWPHHHNWLDRTQLFLRAQELLDLEKPADALVNADDLVSTAARRCGLYELTDATRSQLTAALETDLNRFDQANLILELALDSPEFALT